MASSTQNGTCCLAHYFKCKFNKNDKVRFHSFPFANEELFKKWLVAMRREDFVPTKHSRICGDHFTSSDYYP